MLLFLDFFFLVIVLSFLHWFRLILVQYRRRNSWAFQLCTGLPRNCQQDSSADLRFTRRPSRWSLGARWLQLQAWKNMTGVLTQVVFASRWSDNINCLLHLWFHLQPFHGVSSTILLKRSWLRIASLEATCSGVKFDPFFLVLNTFWGHSSFEQHGAMVCHASWATPKDLLVSVSHTKLV